MYYHISLSSSFLGSLKKFAKENKKRQNKFIYFSDNLAFGPLKNIFEDDFLMERSKFIYKIMEEKEKYLYAISEFINPKEDPRIEGKDYFLMEEDYDFLEHKKFREILKNILPKDKIFIYIEDTAESYLFLSYFLNIYKEKNFKVYFYKIEKKEVGKEYYYKTLGTLHYDELSNIFRNGEILTENMEKFFKKLIFNFDEKNILRTYKNGKIIELSEEFLEEKILKILKNDFKIIMQVLGDFHIKYSKYDFSRENIFTFGFLKLLEKGKIELKMEVEELKHFIYKKMVRKKFYYIKPKQKLGI